ncbi:MAG: hypothetical protein WCL27_13985, partial [Betaproteobacteria bacterium]
LIALPLDSIIPNFTSLFPLSLQQFTPHEREFFVKKLIFAIAIILTLAGCASTPQLSLTKQAQTNIERVDGILTIPQNNLSVTVPATNPGNTGLIGALIIAAVDSARQSSAEKDAAPMIEELRDFDFRTVMLGALTEALAKTDQNKFSIPQRVEVIDSDSSKRMAFDQSTASAILFCNVGYRLESGNLIVSVSAVMYPKTESLKQFRYKPEETNPLDRGNAIYRKYFTFSQQAVTPSTIKEGISDAATKLARHLADDLNHGI